MTDDAPRDEPGSIGERIRWIVEEHLGIPHLEFARRLGVKPPQLSRWINRPGSSPGEAYLERMAALSGVSLPWLRYGVGEPVEAPGAAGDEAGLAEDELGARDLFRHFEGMVRRMGSAGVAPEELRLRKLDVIEGLMRLHAAQGTIPGWVYELRGRILKDEL
jgi:transcriptional regulator with XRE-family HTH domain